ncbi:MAG: VIT1/CCC1 transporter family protein [Actinomycetota bacterium]|nr:VIT1/CCC1 transporter family protein [Actinomycetota bacterium]
MSNLALIMGVAGGRPDPDVILLSGLAGLLAGAFSMAAGEYLSMRVHCEVGERTLAAQRAKSERDARGRRIRSAFSPHRSFRVAEAEANPTVAAEADPRDEAGHEEDSLGSPWAAAATSFGTFTLGAAVPLLPFLATSAPTSFLLSGVLSVAALAGIGGTSSLFAKRPAWIGALRMLLVGGGAAAVTFVIGSVLGVAIA